MATTMRPTGAENTPEQDIWNAQMPEHPPELPREEIPSIADLSQDRVDDIFAGMTMPEAAATGVSADDDIVDAEIIDDDNAAESNGDEGQSDGQEPRSGGGGDRHSDRNQPERTPDPMVRFEKARAKFVKLAAKNRSSGFSLLATKRRVEKAKNEYLEARAVVHEAAKTHLENEGSFNEAQFADQLVESKKAENYTLQTKIAKEWKGDASETTKKFAGWWTESLEGASKGKKVRRFLGKAAVMGGAGFVAGVTAMPVLAATGAITAGGAIGAGVGTFVANRIGKTYAVDRLERGQQTRDRADVIAREDAEQIDGEITQSEYKDDNVLVDQLLGRNDVVKSAHRKRLLGKAVIGFAFGSAGAVAGELISEVVPKGIGNVKDAIFGDGGDDANESVAPDASTEAEGEIEAEGNVDEEPNAPDHLDADTPEDATGTLPAWVEEAGVSEEEYNALLEDSSPEEVKEYYDEFFAFVEESTEGMTEEEINEFWTDFETLVEVSSDLADPETFAENHPEFTDEQIVTMMDNGMYQEVVDQDIMRALEYAAFLEENDIELEADADVGAEDTTPEDTDAEGDANDGAEADGAEELPEDEQETEEELPEVDEAADLEEFFADEGNQESIAEWKENGFTNEQIAQQLEDLGKIQESQFDDIVEFLNYLETVEAAEGEN